MNLLCPNCQKPLTVAEQYAGQPMRCPLCAGTFTVPALPQTPPPPPPPSPPPAPSPKPTAFKDPVAPPPPSTPEPQLREPSPAPKPPASFTGSPPVRPAAGLHRRTADLPRHAHAGGLSSQIHDLVQPQSAPVRRAGRGVSRLRADVLLLDRPLPRRRAPRLAERLAGHLRRIQHRPGRRRATPPPSPRGPSRAGTSCWSSTCCCSSRRSSSRSAVWRWRSSTRPSCRPPRTRCCRGAGASSPR